MAEPFEEIAGSPAALRALGPRGVLRVTGGDRVRFLNGMVTSEVATWAPGEFCDALQLDRKGHILAQLSLLVLAEEVLLETSGTVEPVLAETLEKHIIADDVELARLQGWEQLGIEGPGAVAAIAGHAPAALAPGRFEIDKSGRIWLAGGSLGLEGARVLGEALALADLRVALALPSLSGEACDVLRIQAFRPAEGIDFTDRSFPQEARLEGAVSFTKGCFVGQEIVARIESRGAVNRLLVTLAPERPVAPGAEIVADGKGVGRVTSAASSAATGPVALGYVRKGLARRGVRVEIEGVAAVVTGPE